MLYNAIEHVAGCLRDLEKLVRLQAFKLAFITSYEDRRILIYIQYTCHAVPIHSVKVVKRLRCGTVQSLFLLRGELTLDVELATAHV